MDAAALDLPFLSNIGLMLTYKCTVACPHCIVEAGPHRTEEMQLDEALAWIDQIRSYRDGHVDALVLTGGEPFYNLELLAQVSARGQALGLIVAVVTNAFWASSPDAALRTLAQVPAIQAVSFSTDVYHQQAIPFQHIKNAVEAAKALRRVYDIALCTDNVEAPAYRQIVEELTAIGEAGNIRVTIALPVGRALQHTRDLHYRTTSEPTVGICQMASSPIIFPNGSLMACIGPLLTLPPIHPLFLGNLRQEPLSQILDRAELNPILHTIRAWGPRKLIALLRENGYDALLPKEYLCDTICDPCFKLLSDRRIVAALETIFRNEELIKLVAYARVHYLNEATMANRLHLEGFTD